MQALTHWVHMHPLLLGVVALGALLATLATTRKSSPPAARPKVSPPSAANPDRPHGALLGKFAIRYGRPDVIEADLQVPDARRWAFLQRILLRHEEEEHAFTLELLHRTLRVTWSPAAGYAALVLSTRTGIVGWDDVEQAHAIEKQLQGLGFLWIQPTPAWVAESQSSERGRTLHPNPPDIRPGGFDMPAGRDPQDYAARARSLGHGYVVVDYDERINHDLDRFAWAFKLTAAQEAELAKRLKMKEVDRSRWISNHKGRFKGHGTWLSIHDGLGRLRLDTHKGIVTSSDVENALSLEALIEDMQLPYEASEGLTPDAFPTFFRTDVW
jgi:hypothetical protein